MKRKYPTKEQIEARYTYDPETGIFTSKVDGINPRVRVGARSGKVCPDGYRSLSVDRCRYQASWIAWFLCTGKWPENEMDHINHDRGDDRIANLREADRSTNCGYKRSFVGNRTGYRGLKVQTNGRVAASICVNMKEIHLGTFDTSTEAAKVYDKAAIEHFGDFAILNFPEETVS